MRIGFGRRLVRGGFTNRVDLLDGHSFLTIVGLVLVQPAHLLRDPRLRFSGVAVLIEQLHVFVRACITLFQELLVIVFVPFLIGMFLSALLLLDGLGELPHEIIHARGGLSCALRVFLRRHPPFRRGNRQFIIRALDHHAAVRLAEPFEIKAVGHVLRRLFLPANHFKRFLQWHVEHAHFSRCRQIADAAALDGIERIQMRMRKPLLRIGEREQATGEIRPGVALEFEYHRFGSALDPDLAAHDSLHAVVDLTAHHAVMNSKGHAPIIPCLV